MTDHKDDDNVAASNVVRLAEFRARKEPDQPDFCDVTEWVSDFIGQIVEETCGQFTKWDAMHAMLYELFLQVGEMDEEPTPDKKKVAATIWLAAAQLARLNVPCNWRRDYYLPEDDVAAPAAS